MVDESIEKQNKKLQEESEARRRVEEREAIRQELLAEMKDAAMKE